jgi:hypothetical protein
VLGLTSGELFVIIFILVMVVSAPWWPALGEAIAMRIAGESKDGPDEPPPEA